MKTLLILLTLLPSISIAKDITYFDYKFSIPDNYKTVKNNVSNNSNELFILGEDEKVRFSISKKNIFELDDYGANSHRELFYDLFSDKPSKNKNVLEFRVVSSKWDLQTSEITKNKEFIFFRTNNSMNSLNETVFMVSTPLDDEVLHMSFSNRTNKKFIKSIIDSLQVK
ncbi:MAG: hypothetical protein V3U87_05005 [Methylococcaceae bacterium]